MAGGPLGGIAFSLFRRWLDRNPIAYVYVERLFWLGCVGFVALILMAYFLTALAAGSSPGSLPAQP